MFPVCSFVDFPAVIDFLVFVNHFLEFAGKFLSQLLTLRDSAAVSLNVALKPAKLKDDLQLGRGSASILRESLYVVRVDGLAVAYVVVYAPVSAFKSHAAIMADFSRSYVGLIIVKCLAYLAFSQRHVKQTLPMKMYALILHDMIGKISIRRNMNHAEIFCGTAASHAAWFCSGLREIHREIVASCSMECNRQVRS